VGAVLSHSTHGVGCCSCAVTVGGPKVKATSPCRILCTRGTPLRKRVAAASDAPVKVLTGEEIIDGCIRKVQQVNSYTMSDFVPLHLENRGIGCVHNSFRHKLEKYSGIFLMDHARNVMSLHHSLQTYQDRTDAVGLVMTDLKEQGLIKGWRGELMPCVTAFDEEPLLAVERAVIPVLGFKGYGVHMNAYTKDKSGKKKLWVAKRSLDKPTWPGKLDHLAAGGQPLGMTPIDNMVKEAWEEAGIPEELARQAACVGALSYRQQLGTGEDGRALGIKRDTLFCFDLELPEDFEPVAMDGEVESFQLMDIDDVIYQVVCTDNFKPNCNLVIVHWLVRHGYMQPHERRYLELLKLLQGPELR